MTINEYIDKKQNSGEKVNYSTIAEQVPCAPQYISMIANGKRRPSFIMARRIEQITNGQVPKTNWYPDE